MAMNSLSGAEELWAGVDSNHRRLSQQIYSLPPLATRVPTLGFAKIPFTAMPTFDVVSEVDLQEVRNAVDQTHREIANRFDFKNTGTEVELAGQEIRMHSSTEDRLKALVQVLEEKLVKRQVPLKAVTYGNLEDAAKGTVRQTATLSVGIDDAKSREINKFIKGLGIKGVSSKTQGDQLRVQSKKRDDLQQVIASLKQEDFGIPLQFKNFRD